MKKVNEFLSKWGMLIAVSLLLIISFKTCSITSTVEDNNEKVTELESKVDSLEKEMVKTKEKTVSKEELDYMQKRRMYDVLIYEKELDDGNTSLTEIKEETK